MQNFFVTLFPVIAVFLSGAVSYIIGRYSEKARDFFASAVTLGATVFYGIILFSGVESSYSLPPFYDIALGNLHSIYAFITSVMWFVTTVFSTPYFKTYGERNRYYLFSLVTFGATLGVFLSSALWTLFIFFEIMSFASYVLVAHDRKPETQKASSTYLTISVIGGMAILLGLMLFMPAGEEYNLDGQGRFPIVQTTLMFVGFGAKAGAFPLHIWLPKAHPAAPAPASALLSGVLTKAGIYGILMVSLRLGYNYRYWGKLLLPIGVVTMLLGGVLALLSVNLKRTLACSSMSQIGFILVGISMLNLKPRSVAFGGTILHMINHSLIKLVLFVCAGIVFMNLHKLNLNDIKGFGRGKPFLMIIFLLGALNICGIPPFSGYISKTLLHESILEFASNYTGTNYIIMKSVEYLFLLTGGMTIAYMTKLFVCIFVMKPSGEVKKHNSQRLPLYLTIPLSVCALSLPTLGVFSDISRKAVEMAAPFLNAKPIPEDFEFFSAENLLGSAISIIIGAIIYFFIVRNKMIKDGVYVDFSNDRFDIDERIYKPFVFHALPSFFGNIFNFISELPVYVGRTIIKTAKFTSHAVSDLPDGIIYLMRKTAYREVKPKKPDYHNALVVSKVGTKVEKASALFGVEEEKRKHLALRFAAAAEAVHLTFGKIFRNLSFSMIITCIGLCAVLIFLFFFV